MSGRSGQVATAVALLSNGFLLLDKLTDGWLNVTGFAVALGVVSITGVQKSGRAQGEILGAAEISDLSKNYYYKKVSSLILERGGNEA